MTLQVAEIKVFPALGALSQFGADLFARLARQAVETHGAFLAALSGGGTPSALYRLLAAPPLLTDLPWKWIHFFWGDERCVPPDDHESNYRQAWEAFLSQVPVPAENIHRVKGELEPSAAAADYMEQLTDLAAPGLEFPIFDLVFLGLGADGHTASLFPGSDPDSSSPALAVTGRYQGRPSSRVTLTPQVFNAARTVVILAAGEEKAQAVADALKGPPDPVGHPAQRIQPQDGTLWWLLDEPAASLLDHD
jgi:6-phosphogluconolactonase